MRIGGFTLSELRVAAEDGESSSAARRFCFPWQVEQKMPRGTEARRSAGMSGLCNLHAGCFAGLNQAPTCERDDILCYSSGCM